MQKTTYPLHPAQKDIYLDQLLNIESPQYNIGGYIKLKGVLNKEKFIEAVNSAPTVFDAFKIRFDLEAPDFLCHFDERYEKMEINEIDFSHFMDPVGEAKTWMQKRFNSTFAINKETVLFEHSLLKIADDEFWFFGKYHHLITDGYGFIVWVQYLAQKYKCLLADVDFPFNFLPYQQAAIKASGYYHSPDYESDGNYWKDKIPNKPGKLLQRKFQREANAITKSSTYFISLNEDQIKLIGELELATKIRLHHLTIAALLIYFGKTTQQSEFIFGIPVHKRGAKELRNIVGMFAGIIPYKGSFQKDIRLIDLLNDIANSQKKDYLHQNYLIGDLTRHFKLKASEELCEVVINYERFNFEVDFGAALQATAFQLASESGKNPLELNWQDFGSQQPLQLQIDFWNEYFSVGEIKLFAQRLIFILGQFPAALEKTIGSIEILPLQEHRMLADFNDTKVDYPKDKTIVDLFEEQAAKTPGATAVVFEEEQLTYAALNERANQLAHYLRSKGVKEETLVPICMEQSLEMIVGILGILKAGGAYIPIDAEYPEERISYMLEDTAATIVITSKASRSKLQATPGIEIIELDKDWSSVNCHLSTVNHQLSTVNHQLPTINYQRSTSLAYVIYTSGSTGKPKGVMIEHRSIVNYLLNSKARYIRKKEGGSGSFIHLSYTFDASLTAMFMPLLSGKSVIVGSKHKMEVFEDGNLRKHAPYDFIKITPSHLELLRPTAEGIKGEWLTKKLVIGGEALHLNQFDYLVEKGVDVEVINEYGPTEATVGCSIYSFQTLGDNSALKNNIPIGKPIDNAQLYIVNDRNELLPIGVVGELCIGGTGVARGYLNRPDLTAEKFIQNPFSKEPGSRIYKTGDLARWQTNGNIEFLGRKDDQVKINGYRIELGEIESTLQQCEGVAQGVVLAKEDSSGSKRLVGYVVAEGFFSKETIINELKSKLPEYMVPSMWVKLQNLPLTTNGKIDRKALPDPDASELSGKVYVAPRNELEEKLVSIWQELLEIEKIGIHDNFFELGGHSIKAIQLISRVHKLLNIKIDVRKITSYPTINKLAQALALEKQNQFIEIKPLPEKEFYDLSHAQKRIWILSQFTDSSLIYNGQGAYIIEGRLNVTAFKKAFDKVIERHENLRTVFIEVNGEPKQKILSPVDLEFKIEEFDLREIPQAGVIINQWMEKDANQVFDLAKGPLLRASLFREADEKYLLLFNIHHIISDGWSKGIFLKEFLALYKNFISGIDTQLKPLPIQYKDYAAWNAASFETQGKYWRDIYQTNIPVLNFPQDFERPKPLSFSGAALQLSLPTSLMLSLEKMAGQHNMTINNLLLSLYGLLVSKCSQQEDVVIGSLTSGRSHIDLENLIGVFINFLPIRLSPKKELLLKEYLENSQQTLALAYSNQDYPFDLMVEDCIKQRDISRNPFFDTMVNFHWENNLQNKIQSEENIGIELKPLLKAEKELFQSTLDFQLDIELVNKSLNLNLSYNTNLFTKDRMAAFLNHYVELLESVVKEPGKKLQEYLESLIIKNEILNTPEVSKESFLPVTISASFVIEPVQDYIEYWSKEEGLNIELSFAPYNQVFQQLLNPESLLNSNKGINVLFIRIDDWLKDQTHLLPSQQIDLLNLTYLELRQAIEHSQKINSVPFLIGIVPLYSSGSFASEVVVHMEEMNRNLESSLKKQPLIYLIDLNKIALLYKVGELYDPMSDKIGHMPFTPEFYASLGTFITRKLRAFKTPSYKVLVLDCDNTLWKGVCGEVGTMGVEIDENFNYLQEFLLEKYQEGFLLVLCSKNNEDDVWEVFNLHPKMKLKRKHIAAYRINWQSKSDNLLAISKELNLGVDSFIFIDDSAFEAEQISLSFPGILSLTLPENSIDFPDFIDHTWAFDYFHVTEEDRQRNAMYKTEKNRKEEQVKHGSLSDFLQSLQIIVNIQPLEEKDIDRAVQLSIRTNQFNLNGIRKTREEIMKSLQQENNLNWIIDVKDRFGNYGIVGLLLAKEVHGALIIESFLLSCRVLGRGVENIILSELKKHCTIHQLDNIEAMFQATSKNKPFIEFLLQADWIADDETNIYSFPIKYSNQELLCK